MLPLITLTTDFGVSSPYVAALKGSLLSVCSEVQLVDLTQAIAPQNVRQAAVVLADVTPFFPAGTLHVVVVDPGVGTERKIIYAEIGEQKYLAPDNGVLSYIAQRTPPRKQIELADRRFWRESVSNTFHGRDVFAPVAGHLAAGVVPELLGPELHQLFRLHWPEPQISEADIRGEVLYFDSFGNVITNIPLAEVQRIAPPATTVVAVAGRTIEGLHATYGKSQLGALIALGDSQGRLEVAIVNGNAARELNVQPGEPVHVYRQRGQRIPTPEIS